MGRSIAIATLLLASAAPAAAQTEGKSSTELATEIVTIVQTENSFDELMQSIMGLQAQMMGQQGGDTAQIDGMMKKLTAVLEEEFSKTLKGDMVTTYASVFTQEELQGLLDFYRGPVGQKLIEKTPELTRKSMELQQKNFATLWPKIDQAMKEYLRQHPPGQ